MSTIEQQEIGSTCGDKHGQVDARVVFLTHYIPLYQVRVLQSIAAAVRDFHVLLSTPIEPNRDFTPDWSGLDVTIQDTWTFRRRWRHQVAGFEDLLFVHVPYDTTRQLRSLNPDVVMSLELGARSMGAASYCAKHRQCRLVLCTYMSERTEEGRGWLRRRFRKRLVQRADAVTYNGPSCRKYLNDLGVPDKRLFHFPYAADDRTVYRGPTDRDDRATRHRFLVVGQLSDRKGVMPLMKQVSDYCRQRPHHKVELGFAGEGPLRIVIDSYDLPDNASVQVLGNISPEELGTRMTTYGALIAPSLADEWMLAVNEALQAGMPVVGSIHAQAVTALVRDRVNGWQYDPMIEGSLTAALDAYFAMDSDQVAAMRLKARQSVAERTPRWAASGALDAVKYVLGQVDRRPSQCLDSQ